MRDSVLSKLLTTHTTKRYRRSLLEIRMSILQAVYEGAELPTQIMFKANLSWNALQEHLSYLMYLGLVDEKNVRGHKRYTITERALRVLAVYDDLTREILGVDEKNRLL
ncbi:hypothetical protein B9Q04_01800 [Candidatus Marsarchaeota G2 archaeon BE_D]|jgi:predicted transcriptional regulator|uniref:ArnR1-like winged helix-turn-helix domain-containing protein n=3 Tax=Candidatus Marsarchaeota TaxID=1978152 RepID=A0A2R6CE28_9ARCH|nr:MAG: hypothetical protein B9Q01_06205 [Candidatus Marsarchaeota G1 archaeon OSP_D]PSN87812.1 MAG: hypothetical protein B9Q00_07760 [Candidatus Marsarchaeota G1 archaeon OSP_C]PSO09153.1 MAG: hypothetical protein B9Q04_01800 [Candidatus Marsarchaeota G2 archaeon BE_D]